MFHQRIVDYTEMPVGKRTRQGAITVCERCGRHGAFVRVGFPDGRQTEKWLHIQQTGLFTGGYEDACIRTTGFLDGKLASSWTWKSLDRA